ncbi:MAG: hypothetical protein IPQ10_08545 [Saprospiraceae bacterium]|jgi:hypothetical protein|nr:hypothetical protein [Saprospiraceae bacterium]MBK8151826.1 hypothetical protein [Saprospiraceae bacterium]MBL0261099.1 hypothetical protein [Saprospiraceae bacterium]
MDQSTILEWNSLEKFSTMMIYHSTGQLVQVISDITTTRNVIERQNLASGLYIFFLHSQDGHFLRGKFYIA